MGFYRSPKDYLDAAKSPHTSAEELERLAEAEYSFVRVAVASNPNTPLATLSRLLPHPIESWWEQEVAEAIAIHPNATSELLARLAAELIPLLDNGRHHHTAFRAGILLCCNPIIPFLVIRQLLDPMAVAMQFRKVVARESSRHDVLDHLARDRSETVRRRATLRLDAQANTPTPSDRLSGEANNSP